MTLVTVNFQQCSANVILPEYATDGAAGMDIVAYMDSPIVLAPFERAAIPTGFRMQLPKGYEAQVRPRSGLALKHGITVANAPGTIDSDYRGEILVIMINLSQRDFAIKCGMRIAQMVVTPVVQCVPKLQSKLDISDRGDGGFGSTGL